MNASTKIAILDVDGTLCPGALGVALLRDLMAAGACNQGSANAVLEVLDQYRDGAFDFSTMATRAYHAYGLALAGQQDAVVEAHAREVWTTRRQHLFEFVPALISGLRAHGYELMLISGSPLEMVRLVADELDIEAAYGAVFTRENGRYTGDVDLSSGMPGEKARIFAAATLNRDLCAERCFAIGDSLTDVALFERVGLPLAFEAAPDLATIASSRGWTLATRDDVIERVNTLLDSVATHEAVSAPSHDSRGLSSC